MVIQMPKLPTGEPRLNPRSGLLALLALLFILLTWLMVRRELSAQERLMPVTPLNWALSGLYLLGLLATTWLVGAFPRSRLVPPRVVLSMLTWLLACELSTSAHIATVLWASPRLTSTEQLCLDTLGGLSALITVYSMWRAGHATWSWQQKNSSTDLLTGLMSRSGFMQAFQDRPLLDGTVVLLDLNRLKWINDHHGHAVGDRQMQHLARALTEHLPAGALAARWGGDEFLAVLPRRRTQETASFLNEMQRQLPSLVTGRPAFDYGLAHLESPADLDRSLAVADHALYLAKAQGTDERVGEDHGLVEFSRQLELLDTPEQVLQQGLALCRKLLHFEVAAYTQVSGRQYQAIFVDAEPEMDLEMLQSGASRMLSGLGLQAVEQRRTLVSVDYPNDPMASPSWKANGVKTLIVTPVDQGGQVIGLFTLLNVSSWKAVPLHTQRTIELAALRLGHALDLRQAVEGIRRTLEGGLLGLGVALEARDLETRGHTERVVRLSTALGVALGLNATDLNALRQGAYLHDIGKLSIPDQILLKPGKLSPEEWAVMRSHAEIGAEIAGHIPDLSVGTLAVIRHHHERWDGRGYPLGLAGEGISPLARIFAVCDVYDALTSVRPYKPAWTREEARVEIAEQSGRQFDPRVVEAFLTLITSFVDSVALETSG